MVQKIQKIIFLFAFLCTIANSLFAQLSPKREFRGVWMHVIGQDYYQNMTPEQMKVFLIEALDQFQALNMNAVIFQVRPTADAFYNSHVEPWSKFLSGQQGMAPPGQFDPMEFMIEECHQRNMEFHAWLNPYRVTSDGNDHLAKSHIYYRHPEWFVEYGSQLYFDPGIPACRKHICEVVHDIVKRYDVDAIHMDDYFYPYPIAGEQFPDDVSFKIYGKGFKNKEDWRRNNVNQLIDELHHTIKKNKSWVRLGISPFGIYRNKRSTPDSSGSLTNGLQNYDDLYADVKLWVKKAWIDYNIPQIYWEIGHQAADYETLIRWWSQNNYGAHLYIGQDVVRTVNASDLFTRGRNQLTRKMQLEHTIPAIYGHCFWPGYEILNNTGGIADSLRNSYHRYPAMIPAYKHLNDGAPNDVRALKTEWTGGGYKLCWKKNGNPDKPKNAQYYVVYRFLQKEPVNLKDPSNIVTITRGTEIILPYAGGQTAYKYIVTSVDRYHNESKRGRSLVVKL